MKPVLITLVILYLIPAVPAVAQAPQSVLSHFPDDVTAVAEIDIGTFARLFNERNRTILSRRIGNTTGIDPVRHFTSMAVGFSEKTGERTIYLVLRGSLNAAQLAGIARGTGKVIQESNIAGRTAYADGGLAASAKQTIYIVDGGPGLVIAGQRTAIERLLAVQAGKVKNAGGNAALRALSAKTPRGAGIRAFGLGTGLSSGAEIESFALGLGFTASVLNFDLHLATRDARAYDRFTAMLAQAAGLAPAADPGGRLTEVLAAIVSERTADGFRVSASVPVTTIEYLNTNMERMIANAMMASLKANAEKRQKK